VLFGRSCFHPSSQAKDLTESHLPSPTDTSGKLRIFISTAPSSGRTPLGRGSDGRFGLRRFRAKLTPTAFGTRRAFPHALPPSLGLRSVPSPVSPCFSSLPLW
jgi:hypothetical protein